MRKVKVKDLRHGDFFTLGGGCGMCQYSGNLRYWDEFNQRRQFAEFQREQYVFVYT